MDISRRDFVLSLSLGTTGFLAGCLGSGQSGGESTSQDTTANEPQSPTGTATKSTSQITSETATSTSTSRTDQTSTAQTSSPIATVTTDGIETPSNVGEAEGASWSAEESPQITGRIGKRSQLEEGDRPHLIQIWNDASTTRTIHLSLTPTNSPKRPIFEEAYQLKADSYAELKLMIPDDFVAKAGVSAGSTQPVAEIPSELVDCNESSTYIVARSDGSFDWSYFTTEMGCELIDTTTDVTTG